MDFIQKIKKLYHLGENQDIEYYTQEIKKIQNRFNIQLPATLKRYFYEIGKLDEKDSEYRSGNIGDELLPPVFYLKTHDYLVFSIARFIYGGQYLFIKLDDCAKANPPVYLRRHKENSLYIESLDVMLLQNALRHAIYNLDYTAVWRVDGIWNHTPEQEENYEKLRKTWVDVWTEVELKSIHENYRHSYFSSDFSDIIYEVELGDHDVAVHYGTNDMEKFTRFSEIINRSVECYLIKDEEDDAD
jgi:hypothetical protein